MKKLFYLNILLFFVVLTSCNKDLGNYDYHAIDSLEITGIPTFIDVRLGQNLMISPKLSSSLNNIQEDDLTFQWIVYKGSDKEDKILLGNTKILNTTPPLLVGSYSSYLVIHQISTNRIWTTPFQLNIMGEFRTFGWFVLSEKDKQAHLDFYQDDPKKWNTYPVKYSDFNLLLNDVTTGEQFKLEGEPISLANFKQRDINTFSAKNFLYVNTTANTYKLNVEQGFLYNTAQDRFFYETIFGNPKSADYTYSFNETGASICIKDNNVYSLFPIMSKFYNLPLNRNSSDGKVYKISRFVAAPPINPMMNTLLFDTDNKRFVTMNAFGDYANPISSADQIIDVADTKMDLVWMGHTMALNGQAIAIMKDSKNAYYLLRMGFDDWGQFSVISLTEITNTLTDINKAKHFAVDNQYGYLFYASDHKVYQYDIDAKRLKTAVDVGNNQISLLKFERLVELAPGKPGYTKDPARLEPILYSLIVASYDPNNANTSGKVSFHRIQPLMGDLKESFKAFEGQGKVVDIQYIDLPDNSKK